MKDYTKFITERKKYKLTTKDSYELQDFLNHVKDNLEEEPTLLRAAYARIQGILSEIRKGNVTKGQLSYFFYVIYQFIEDKKRKDELREWSEKLLSIDPENYDTLLSIIDEYNQLVHKNKDEYGKINNQDVFNIRSWVFETEGIEPVEENIKTEEDLTEEDVEELFKSGDLPWEEQQKLKHKLPSKCITELDDERDWKVGDIMHDGKKHYLVVENYEDYCDFGCGYIRTYLDNNPDIDEDEFGEYVTQHNKADRDMGELQDVCKEEIERLGKEFKKEMVKESKDDFYHSTLDDDYWKEISDLFPNYNNPDDEDCDKAVEYIFSKMKEKYPDENIGEEVKKQIHGGIT